MAKEPDQTRWVGIRPTDPPETIPVSMAAAPPCTGVYPCNPATRFPTETQKRTPAIGDLQAVEDTASGYDSHGSIDCSVNAWRGTAAVPAGEIHIINAVGAQNLESMCDIELWAFIDGIARPLKCEYSVQPNQIVTWSGAIVMLEDDLITVNFVLGGTTDPLKVWHVGYQVKRY